MIHAASWKERGGILPTEASNAWTIDTFLTLVVGARLASKLEPMEYKATESGNWRIMR